jgi:hypothetical protein
LRKDVSYRNCRKDDWDEPHHYLRAVNRRC